MFTGRMSYFADTVAAPVVAFYLLLASVLEFEEHQLVRVLGFVLLGFGAWTLVEYLLHRFFYHAAPIVRDYHLVHHAEPRAFISSPPLVGTGLIALATFGPLSLLSLTAAYGMSVGMLVGYTIYMVVHHAFHNSRLAHGSWFYGLRRHHMLHHHHEGCNFGVTTAFWDVIFGTSFRTPGRSKANVQSLLRHDQP